MSAGIVQVRMTGPPVVPARNHVSPDWPPAHAAPVVSFTGPVVHGSAMAHRSQSCACSSVGELATTDPTAWLTDSTSSPPPAGATQPIAAAPRANEDRRKKA
ncbi:MAG: hypothetical protein R3B70_27955 [Polyangiaceae bacterium]